MKSLFKPVLIALAVGISLSFAAPSFAQSTQNMSYLTKEERADFNKRLQRAGASADRSRVTAEMNRIIQQRRLEERKAERAKKKLFRDKY
ncbi:MAG: hypothetical protein COB46_08455 [Rhodospirillaceae bacterium]|nr:MAG: hypothetical protein COB46_08455 [Rhodospirillaceae bacterium]